jgi:nucleoside-diphosphate-sugar epimerase
VRILIIGGTRFVGRSLAFRLLARGDQVTLFNRGTLADPFGSRVQRIRGDRRSPELERALLERAASIDAVVDFAAYERADVDPVLRALAGSNVHYVFISTGQVYLVRTPRPVFASEADYEGPLMSAPPRESRDHGEWSYGIHKRAIEDALGSSNLVHTRVRLPMVNGERDYLRRIESYLVRMLDGGPILLPGGGAHRVRHVYGLDVAIAVASMLCDPRTYGRAFNLAQDEAPPLLSLLEKLASMLGARLNAIEIDPQRVISRGLELVEVSPFSGTWMSNLDPERAKCELGFAHRPLDVYLESVVASYLSHPPDDRPPSYAQRSVELEIARAG